MGAGRYDMAAAIGAIVIVAAAAGIVGALVVQRLLWGRK